LSLIILHPLSDIPILGAREYAVSQWHHDLGAFVKLYDSGVYITVLKLLANFPMDLSWSEIMSEVGRALSKPLSKSVMHRVITNLIRFCQG
jgi:hypothetical protein